MKKVTFIFPNYELMWRFKDQSKAINVEIVPRKNQMSGLFAPQEIELAVKNFNALYPETYRTAV